MNSDSTIKNKYHALNLLNRWCKSNIYDYQTVELLYEAKDRLLKDWYHRDRIKLTAIVKRDTIVINKIKKIIETPHLWEPDPIGYDVNWWHDYNQVAAEITMALWNLEMGEYEIFYTPEELAKLEQDYQQKVLAFAPIQQEFDRVKKYNQKLETEYKKELQKYKFAKQKAGEAWAKSNNMTIPRSNSGKNRANKWVQKLENRGFKYNIESPPIPQYLKYPDLSNKPQKPQKYSYLSQENYQPGINLQLDSYIKIAEAKMGKTIPINREDNRLDDWLCLLEGEFESETIEQLKIKAIAIFQKIVNGEFTNSAAAYDELTEIPLNYEAIAIESYYRRGQEEHKHFNNFIDNNLNPQGYWLLEFDSPDLEYSYHVPYQKRGMFTTNLALIENRECLSGMKFGSSLTPEEIESYPLEKVLSYLGFEPLDFSLSKKEVRKSFKENYYNIEEDDDNYEWWKDAEF